MSAFDTFAMVDWAGGADSGPAPRQDAIWAAVVRGNERTAPEYLRNRDVALNWLLRLVEEETGAGRRLMIGFDFPFGYPAGFAQRVIGSSDPLELWSWLADRLDRVDSRFDLAGEINAIFPGIGPFWFNGLLRDIDQLPRRGGERSGHGMTERREVETRARGTFTCWQMGGAGAVGSQAMTGMATLARLRAAFPEHVAVWPYEPLDRPVALVEIWPSLAEETVRSATADYAFRDAAQVAVLSAAIAQMQKAGTLEAALGAGKGPDLQEEGWILGVGAESALQDAAEIAMRPRPPQLDDDCFALPPGVNWTPVDDALDRLRRRLGTVVASETVSLDTADGRILARDHFATRANPPAANSAVDGFGFDHSAVGRGAAVLPLVSGRAAAGATYTEVVPPGHAIRILTGALLPEGVDTVVLEEDVRVSAGQVAFHPPKPFANRRRAGEDVDAGALALPEGRSLRAPDIALAAAVGLAELEVRQRLRVGILSTGDELAASGSTADPARTYDANRPMLLSLMRRWGYVDLDLGHAPDDRIALKALLDGALGRVDVILTSGGASAGDEDHVSSILRETGTLNDWRIALKPGRPLALGLWRGVPVFGLPGNPVAALVCTLIFAHPALAVLAGRPWPAPRGFDVPAAFRKNKKPGRREYLRARLNGNGRAEVFPSEGSGRISGLSWAEGLVEIGDGARVIEPGDPVRYLPYSVFGI